MRYADTITVSYPSGRSADGGGGFLSDGTPQTVYSGSADVQDREEKLRNKDNGVLEGRAIASVFLPDHTSVADEGIQEGHNFSWSDRSKSGRVIGIRHLDNSFEVSFE